MQKSATSKQAFFALIGLCVLSGLSIILVLYLGNNRLRHSNAEISTLLSDRDITRQKLDKLTALADQGKKSEQIEKTVTAIIPRQKKQQTLIAEIIYKATSEANIKASQIVSFNFSGNEKDTLGDLSGTVPLKTVAGVYEYPFSMNLQNVSYSKLLKLLSEIESNQRLIQVSNVNISPSGEQSDVYSVNLVMKAYVQP